jgi:DNA topoisomerase-3
MDLPEISVGYNARIANMKLRRGQTSAPGHLTESELIGLMEKNGIGTDASIATHINNIVVRNYVTLNAGRTLTPTNLGVVLVHGYLRIDPALVLPDVRAAIESFCNMIAKGAASKDQVVEHSLNNFRAKFKYFTSRIPLMDSLFEASFSPLAATGKFLCKCGKCNRYMRYIPLKPQRLYCPTCEETYSLPQNGTIKLYKELKCPLDNFELVLFSLGNTAGAQGKSYPLCPYCYSHPPTFTEEADVEEEEAADEAKDVSLRGGDAGESKGAEEGDDDDDGNDDFMTHMGCDSCLHPSCKHSSVLNAMCECPGNFATGRHNQVSATPNTCSGMLVLDVNSKPNWKLSCNR